MKIVIVGPISLPLHSKVIEFIDKDEKLFFSNYHNHPWIYNLANGLKNIEDTEVHILSITNLVSKDYHFQLDNIYYHLIHSENKYLNVISFFYKEIQKIIKQIKIIKPDIIHAQSRGYFTLAAMLSKFPVVVTNHGQLQEHYKALGKKDFRYFISIFYEKWVNKKMQYCIGVSPNCINDCIKYLPKNNIFLIENAINPVFFKERLLEDQNTILFVGSITPLKQVIELILAISKVENCKLKLVYQGYLPSYFEEIKQLIINLNIENKVIFLGQKNQLELAEEISKCTALCLPSKYESFGMVLAEAMAVGKPVIASDIEGPGFIVKHKHNGLLFQTGNVDELSGCISKLINDKLFATELAQNAKKDAIERFSSESVAKKTFQVYKQILNF